MALIALLDGVSDRNLTCDDDNQDDDDHDHDNEDDGGALVGNGSSVHEQGELLLPLNGIAGAHP